MRQLNLNTEMSVFHFESLSYSHCQRSSRKPVSSQAQPMIKMPVFLVLGTVLDIQLKKLIVEHEHIATH